MKIYLEIGSHPLLHLQYLFNKKVDARIVILLVDNIETDNKPVAICCIANFYSLFNCIKLRLNMIFPQELQSCYD